jgi:hypothetical protein
VHGLFGFDITSCLQGHVTFACLHTCGNTRWFVCGDVISARCPNLTKKNLKNTEEKLR